jgi:hypothetical protein
MTPESQRIAIAEACGWKRTAKITFEGHSLHGKTYREDNLTFVLPNYLHDLNAMHEAEKVLTDDQLDRYPFILNHVVDSNTTCRHKRIDCFAYHATAAQRAETFLRTLNLWTTK